MNDVKTYDEEFDPEFFNELNGKSTFLGDTYVRYVKFTTGENSALHITIVWLTIVVIFFILLFFLAIYPIVNAAIFMSDDATSNYLLQSTKDATAWTYFTIALGILEMIVFVGGAIYIIFRKFIGN